MFLREQPFKRLLKKAYKGGLIVANTEERIYLAGWGWEMDIKKRYLPKTILAQIIELAGELPEVGERFMATKDGNQMEVGDMEVLMKTPGVFLTPTKLVVLPEMGSSQRILQVEDATSIVLLNEQVFEMVDRKCVDTNKGEDEPCDPIYCPGEGIYWKNSAMKFKAMYTTVDDTEEKLIEALEGLALWKG